MNLLIKTGGLLVVTFVLCAALELGETLSIPGVHSVISPAEAIVGRPLTPVSVAGVGRRTVRRCAAGAYHC
jgi:hypothetical protein